MRPDLRDIYISTGVPPFQEGAVLKCHVHPEWEADVDGTDMESAIRKATDHVTEIHDKL